VLVAGHQLEVGVGVEVFVAGQGDVVDVAGAEPSAKKRRDGRGLGQFVVADDVGGDVSYAPVGASD